MYIPDMSNIRSTMKRFEISSIFFWASFAWLSESKILFFRGLSFSSFDSKTAINEEKTYLQKFSSFSQDHRFLKQGLFSILGCCRLIARPSWEFSWNYQLKIWSFSRTLVSFDWLLPGCAPCEDFRSRICDCTRCRCRTRHLHWQCTRREKRTYLFA